MGSGQYFLAYSRLLLTEGLCGRYAEITGVPDLQLSDFTCIVISSDLRPTGHFTSSHKLINQLHDNVIRSLRGNLVSIPTDCPQRD